MRMNTSLETIDEYLAPLSPDKQSALGKLRKAIRAAAPRAEEGISYGMPAFRLDGKPLVYFGAAAKHCAFYPGSARLIGDMKKELAAYETSKGTIRFPPDTPLPTALVKKIVKARIAENAAVLAARRTKAKKRG